MAKSDERELAARVDAADANAHKCINGHAIIGNNIYRDSMGRCSCWLCRIERARDARREPAPSRRKPRYPLNPDLVRSLRLAAGVDIIEQRRATRDVNDVRSAG